MNEIYLTNETSGITPAEVEKCMDELLAQYPDLKKVLSYRRISPAATPMPGN